MRKYLLLLCLAASTKIAAQDAKAKLSPGQTELKTLVQPPSRDTIVPVTIELVLTGKISRPRLDTTLTFILTDRTKASAPALIDPAIKFLADEWEEAVKAKKIKRTLFIKYTATAIPKHDEYAELAISTQPGEEHTLLFSSKAKAASVAAVTEEKAVKPVVPDTIRYNKSFGYDNGALLFDLKVKKYEDKTEVEVCSNRDTPPANTCNKRILLGDVSRENFDSAVSALAKKIIPGAYDVNKIAPKADDMFVNYKETVVKKTPVDSTEFQKLNATINEKLQGLFNEKPSSKAIGYFKLMNKEVHLIRPHKATGMFGNKMIRNSNDEESEEVYKIDSVEIVITNGCIRKNGLKVMLSNKRVYRNRNAPITLYTFENRKADYLLADSLGEKFGLRVGQVINYIYNEKFNYPSDQVAHLGPAKGTDSLYVGTTVGELLDVNIFSDLLALLGRKPNGIIQTQVTATFITNSGNVKNHDITFNNTIKAYFKLSKLDSKFAQLDSNAFANKTLDTVKRLYLSQTAYLQAGLKDNVVRIGVGSNQQLLLNIGSEISLTNADSIYHKDIITINYFTELEHTISRLDNFGLETSARFIYQWVSNSAPFNNKKSIWIFNPQVVIYYYPFSNPNNKIYVRYAHYSQLGDGRYNYPQFQFGFKTNLFSKKDKAG